MNGITLAAYDAWKKDMERQYGSIVYIQGEKKL